MSDLIKREDAIKAISISCGTCLARDTEDCDKCSVPKLCRLISAIPSVDRPSGEWMPKNSHTMYCDVCGFEEVEWRTQDYDYCPRCGARMKGADDEDN